MKLSFIVLSGVALLAIFLIWKNNSVNDVPQSHDLLRAPNLSGSNRPDLTIAASNERRKIRCEAIRVPDLRAKCLQQLGL